MRNYRPVPVFNAGHAAPIKDLNTTPLIDVMLVLLIMFIVTIPIGTHKVAVDLPQGPPPPVAADPVIHWLSLMADGGLTWDGAAIPESALPARLAAAKADAAAQLHLRADGAARYEDYDRVLAAIKSAGIERLGLVGNEAFAGF
ncbi:biopolymer transporter ExbD [Allosphingosinicella flava]|uniref:Biopolymer transporter ExbD n=1 Tax=Allosphingosinicella flava TaxID=2771430 RepID=A0A7T2GI01_9SPHN|nr:biopolymer transporter ExbD [Sphingosinicella flava]QPQ54241.1 biopolymer transporter ExbD [Sphingosinicella flava]